MKPTSRPNVTDPCPFEADLKALIDGELPDLQRHKVERHLAECASCTELRRHLRQLTQEVHAMSEQASCPESVTERVLSSLPERGPNRLRFFEFSLVRWLAAGGMAAVVAAIIFPIFAQSREAARRSNSQGMYQVSRAPATSAPSAGGQDAIGGEFPLETVGGAAGASPPGGSSGNPLASEMRPDAADRSEAPIPSSDSEATQPRRKGFGSQQFALEPYARPQADSAANAKVVDASDDVSKYTHGKAMDEVLRKVVKSALLSVQVNERLETLQDRIAKKVKADEGYVESMNLSAPDSGKRTSRMALRVPVSQYENTIEYISGLGEVSSKSLGGKDITGTWLDERKAVRDLRKKEERYAAAYRNARNRTERDRARRQLLNLRPILQSSEEQFAETAKLAALARIDVTLVEEPQAKIRGDLGRDLQSTTKHASAAFLTALRVPATLLIWLAIFTPLWLPCLLAYRWATRMARRQQASPLDAT